MSDKQNVVVINQGQPQAQTMGCLELAISAVVIGLFVMGFLFS